MFLTLVNYISLNVKKHTFRHLCLAKIQISLYFHIVWPESSLGAFWIARDAKFLHADNKDSWCSWTHWFESSLGPHVSTQKYWYLSQCMTKPHYENTPIQIYWKISPPKTDCFQIKILIFFHISKIRKNSVYPCEPQFYYIKVGFKVVKIIQVCFHDVQNNVRLEKTDQTYSDQPGHPPSLIRVFAVHSVGS